MGNITLTLNNCTEAQQADDQMRCADSNIDLNVNGTKVSAAFREAVDYAIDKFAALAEGVIDRLGDCITSCCHSIFAALGMIVGVPLAVFVTIYLILLFIKIWKYRRECMQLGRDCIQMVKPAKVNQQDDREINPAWQHPPPDDVMLNNNEEQVPMVVIRDIQEPS